MSLSLPLTSTLLPLIHGTPKAGYWSNVFDIVQGSICRVLGGNDKAQLAAISDR